MSRLRLLLIVFILTTSLQILADESTDSLRLVVKTAHDDTLKVNELIELSSGLFGNENEQAMKYATEAKDLAVKLNFPYGEAYALKNIGIASFYNGDYLGAILSWQEALAIFRKIENKEGIANMLSNIGAVYFNQGVDDKAIEYNLQSLKISEEINNKLRMATALLNLGATYSNRENTRDLALEYYNRALALSEEQGDMSTQGTTATNIGQIYFLRGDADSALFYFEKGLQAYQKAENGNVPFALYNIGTVQTFRGDYDEAIKSQTQAYETAKRVNRMKEMAQAKLGLADIYRKKGDDQTAIVSYKEAMEIAKEIGARSELKDAYQGLAELNVKLSNYKDAYKYQSLYGAIKDTLYNAEVDKRLGTMTLEFELNKKQSAIDLLEKDKLQKVQETKVQRLFIFSISGALLTAILLSLILYRNNQTKQRSNALLMEQKAEIQETLEKLKATQSQLIQSEKMASLGELTAGIAHEIQNPLNFVNNFSEVSYELLDEMKEEVEAGNLEFVKEILSDLRINLQKINSHGKRADSIVKGMLQHSRTGSGTKESVSINAMADEYLRLTFHGLVGKDPSFNADLKTDFDDKVGDVMVIPQDLGRVILNILTNAFYAVNDKRKKSSEDYKPTVSVSTKKLKNKVVISIGDNGNGIPPTVLGKIFQPFFTTKPTGEGTGLGLSLSYDIITKGHGGELKVDTKEGEGTEFSIILPA